MSRLDEPLAGVVNIRDARQVDVDRLAVDFQCSVPIEGRWLDVGCDNGVFVETVASEGVQAEGVELSQYAVSAGRDRGLDLHVGTIDDLPQEATYDCITAFDVL